MHNCIQVLSNTVGKAMELTGGPETVKTTEFILTFDKFFDCLHNWMLGSDQEMHSSHHIVQEMILESR